MGLSRLMPGAPGRSQLEAAAGGPHVPPQSTMLDSRLVGTPSYMDPEYLRTGRFGPKSDTYSLGEQGGGSEWRSGLSHGITCQRLLARLACRHQQHPMVASSCFHLQHICFALRTYTCARGALGPRATPTRWVSWLAQLQELPLCMGPSGHRRCRHAWMAGSRNWCCECESCACLAVLATHLTP